MLSKKISFLQINRGYTNKYLGLAVTANDSFFFDECISWFYSFTYDIVDELEEQDSLSKLLSFVDASRSRCSKGLIEATEGYILESFMPDLGRLCFRHYRDVANGDIAQNSFSESYNSLRYRVANVKSNNKLHVSGDKLLSLSDKRSVDLRAGIERQERTTRIANSGVKVDDVEAQLSREIVPYMCDKAINQ